MAATLLVSRANMAAAPSLLKLGDEFLTWAEFKAALDNFQETTHAELSKITSKKVETENRKLPEGVQKSRSSQSVEEDNAMAFGRGLERQNSATFTGLSAALDGIEIKVGESFKPPRRVTLPISYHHKNPSEALSLEYDFRHENSVLEMAKKRREYQQAMEAQRRAENEASSSCPSPPENDATDTDSSPPGETTAASLPRPPTNPALASYDPSSILQPQPAAPKTQDSQEGKPKVPAASFKITDFEGESSPFDDMELKTINVMEELKTVLLDSNVCSDGEEQRPADSNGAASSAADQERVEVTVARKHGSRVAFKARSESGGGGKAADSNGIPNGVIPSAAATSKLVAANNPFLKNSPLPPIPTTSPELDASSPPGLPYPTSHSDNTGALLVDVPNTGSKPVDIGPGYMRHALPEGASNGPLPTGPSSLPTAVANPLYEQYVRQPRPGGGQDPAVRLGHAQRSELAEGPPASTAAPAVKSIFKSADVREPECLRSLDASGKRFVSSITGMGFPLERVAWAVQTFGQDDKKVIDRLCLLDRLCQRGFPESRVEEALDFHSGSEAEVGSYLSLLLKFEEMGFPQDKIKEALIVSSNDEHKALDMLMT
ncbi:Ubiquitin-associated protein 1 [Branchiostoma belcheri]|nr:Ubiquitin-associated protein 1 [Branchiostoma belcheri]